MQRNRFAFALKDRLVADGVTGNFCFSPLSVDLCLSMLLNGTAGQSKSALAKTLFLDGTDLRTVNDGNYSLVSALLGNSFTCANSIWTKTSDPLKPDFEDRIEHFYHGEAFAVPQFDSSVVARINAWTSDHTKGRIPQILDELGRTTSVVLVNALTFDGTWLEPFAPEATTPAQFSVGGKEAATVPTMHLLDRFAYAEAGGAKAIRMGYQGGKFSMVFILPPANVPATDYLKKLDAKEFAGLLSHAKEQRVDISLPKFEFREGYDLVRPLGEMGMAPLFAYADLSGITNGPGKDSLISQIRHVTYIKVYEEGTQAAAATAVTAKALAIAPVEPKTFNANRPFLFALMHDDTDTVVFLGLVNDPR
ncbi:MAG TPA: serpin family protein [Fimbriimonadaceae bacterium]|nr:serpin family protein [Fimbriimonadaceae bacterium]